MRQFIKEQILAIIDSMYELHQILINGENLKQRIVFVEDCQEAGNVIKNVIEENATVSVEVQESYLNYLEVLERIKEIEEIDQKLLGQINKYPDTLKKIVNMIPTSYHVVFLPYKAAMWDSLESIWKATLEDENCISHVIPIPFFEYNSNLQEWESRYEGELFPDDIPITPYNAYSIEAMQPDVVYIHNPYDAGNRVTTIHPDYYSDKLKLNVGKLIYVPYYVTSGFFTPEHLELPAYQNVDYIVVQSEHVRSKFLNTPHYNKVISLGSPKLDHMIQTCTKDIEIPKEWKEKITNKKVFMLNSSISDFLYNGELYIKKLYIIFKEIYKNEKVILIWRPHPLLEGTMKSMRPHLLEQYKKVLEFYKEKNIGIFDTSPNLSTTIAISDAYIGDGSSSVYNLFAVIGKPIFILNNLINEKYSEQEKRYILAHNGVSDEGKILFLGNMGGLFSMDVQTRHIQQENLFNKYPKWLDAYMFLEKKKETIFLSPFYASNPAKYSIKKQEFSEIEYIDSNESLYCNGVIVYKDSIFYLPAINSFILEYQSKKEQWIEYRECIERIPKNQKRALSVVRGYAVKDNILWMTLENSHCIIEFNMDTSDYRYHALGESEYGYSSIVVDGEWIWLSEVTNGTIIRWNYTSLEIQAYRLPKNLYHWGNTIGQRLVYKQLVDMGEYLVGVPGFSQYAIKIHKETGEIKRLAPEFWKDSNQVSNGYHPNIVASASMAVKITDKLLCVQRTRDKAMAIIDVEKEEYEMFYPTIAQKDFDDLLENEDGFEQSDPYHIFSRRESQFFSFEGFINDVVNNRLEDVKKRQLKAIETMADNLDGSSGKKIHAFVMSKI